MSLMQLRGNDDDGFFSPLYYGHKKSGAIRVLIKCLREKKHKGGVQLSKEEAEGAVLGLDKLLLVEYVKVKFVEGYS